MAESQGLQRREVEVAQGRVARHAGIANPAVEAGMNLQQAGPVVRGDHDLQPGQVRHHPCGRSGGC